jgi:hypothetical protein
VTSPNTETKKQDHELLTKISKTKAKRAQQERKEKLTSDVEILAILLAPAVIVAICMARIERSDANKC